MRYSYSRRLDCQYGEAVRRIKEALTKEGFGVLTEIDVRATLKKKLNIDYEDYIILGACNPSLAHMALSSNKEAGLLLPCNVIVYKDRGPVSVSVVRPIAVMSIADNEILQRVAKEAEARLKKAIKRA